MVVGRSCQPGDKLRKILNGQAMSPLIYLRHPALAVKDVARTVGRIVNSVLHTVDPACNDSRRSRPLGLGLMDLEG